MKKLYSCMLAAMLALAANAEDYYLCGGPVGWNLKVEAGKFTDQGDGTYVLDYNGTLTTGFKINNGTWDKEYGGTATLEIGKVYDLEYPAGFDSSIPLNGKIENPHMVFNPTAKTLLVTGTEVATKTIYGIHGDIFGDPNWSTEKMTEANGKWTLSKTIEKGNFGIKKMDADSESQTGWISSAGDAAVILNTAMSCTTSGGKNFSIEAGTYTFSFDPEAMTLTVTDGSGDEPGLNDTDWSKWWVNLRGDFNDWNDNGVQPGDDPIVEFKDVEIGSGRIDIKIWDGKADHFYYNSSLTLNEWISLTEGTEGDKMTMPGATASSVYTIKVDVENMKMYATLVSGGDEPGPTPAGVKYVLHGNCFGGNWQDVAMTESNGKWVLADKECQKGEFGIKRYEGEVDTWLSSTGASNVVVLNTPMSVGGENSSNFNIAAGTFTFTFDPSSMTLTVTGKFGEEVEDIITYYVSGKIFDEGTEWTDVAMTEAGGKWTLAKECVAGEFGIKGANQFNVQRFWYSAPKDATSVELGEAMTLAASDNANFNLEEGGNYLFTLDLNAMTLTVINNCPVAIKEIEAAEDATVYYNMQGVRVLNPAEGMYVKVVNGKATKVVVK